MSDNKVNFTYEGKVKRLHELLDELKKQIEVSKNDVIKTRKDVDEMFARVTRNIIIRQEAINYINDVYFNRSKDANET
jgi:uncharacterized membrane protein